MLANWNLHLTHKEGGEAGPSCRVPFVLHEDLKLEVVQRLGHRVTRQALDRVVVVPLAGALRQGTVASPGHFSVDLAGVHPDLDDTEAVLGERVCDRLPGVV